MGTIWFGVWSVIFIIFKASLLGAAEESSSLPRFKSDLLKFNVSRKHLREGTRLGKVSFTDCTKRTRCHFTTDDRRFAVQTDNVLTVKRAVVLHKGHLEFFIYMWDSEGHKKTFPVMVLHHGNNNGNDGHHHGNNHPHNQQDSLTETGSATNTDGSVDPQKLILHFPKSGEGLRRRKRDWVIPPLSVSENHRGPYPLFVAQIRSSEDKKQKIFYSITGPGADQPPVGLFTMNRATGNLYITQELDREKQDKYIFSAHAVAEGAGTAEEPMEIIINVIDQNDNKPVFNQSTYMAQVPEASQKGYNVGKVFATDADEPENDNSDLRYSIMNQDPQLPAADMFIINPITGQIRVNEAKLDREKYPQYTLTVSAADLKGEGLSRETKVIIKLTDSNNLAPVFTETSYRGTVEENKPNAEVVQMLVTDGDEPLSPAWNAVFKIVDGDPGKYFSVKTGSNKQEGIISTVKGLDFEKASTHTLLVSVVNEAPFDVVLTTSTTTVTVTVKDVNEAPIFDPKEEHVSKSEDLPVGSEVVRYTASDPDTARKQKVMYKIISDPAGWLVVDKETGLIKVKNEMDRESPFVQDDKYTALIGAYDEDQVRATGTGTLVIELQDVNDNSPTIVEREFWVCNKKPAPQLLTVTDKDGPGFTFPYSVSLSETAKANWTAVMNGTRTGIILNLKTDLKSGQYQVAMTVSDNQGSSQLSSVTATVCDCTGGVVPCQDHPEIGSNLPVILGVLRIVVVVLMTLLLLLLFLCACGKRLVNKCPLRQAGNITGNYQDCELNVHHGSDDQSEVSRNEAASVSMAIPQDEPRPTDPDEITNFTHDVSEELQRMNRLSDGDQDYDYVNE